MKNHRAGFVGTYEAKQDTGLKRHETNSLLASLYHYADHKSQHAL